MIDPDPQLERPSLWRVPALWLVIGLPALAVVSGLAMLLVALQGADRPLNTSASAPTAESMTPAVQARNHVAAPGR